MSKPEPIDAISQGRFVGDISADPAGCAVADATHQPRVRRMRIAEPSPNAIPVGVDPAVLKSRFEDYSSSRLDAAIGIKNGLIGGMALWIFAYLLYSLFRFFA